LWINAMTVAVLAFGLLQVGPRHGQIAETCGVNSWNKMFRRNGAGWENVRGHLK